MFPGVWRIIEDQEIYFLKTFEIALRKMNKKLRYVSDIMFAYFHQQKCGDAGNGDYLGGLTTIPTYPLVRDNYYKQCNQFQI